MPWIWKLVEQIPFFKLTGVSFLGFHLKRRKSWRTAPAMVGLMHQFVNFLPNSYYSRNPLLASNPMCAISRCVMCAHQNSSSAINLQIQITFVGGVGMLWKDSTSNFCWRRWYAGTSRVWLILDSSSESDYIQGGSRLGFSPHRLHCDLDIIYFSDEQHFSN